MNSLSGGERHRFFLRRGGNYHDVSLVSGADTRKDGRGFALSDFDNDGWLDFVMVSPNTPKIRMMRNQIGNSETGVKTNQVVQLNLVGGQTSNKPSKDWSPRDAYGSRLIVKIGDQIQAFDHTCGEGISTQNSDTLRIGLGKADQIDELTIRWPSGKTSTLKDIPAGKKVTIKEGESS